MKNLTANIKNNNKNVPTIYDVARVSGLSIATVSRFWNGTAPVSLRSSAKIAQAIKKLGWSPNELAVVLAKLRVS